MEKKWEKVNAEFYVNYLRTSRDIEFGKFYDIAQSTASSFEKVLYEGYNFGDIILSYYMFDNGLVSIYPKESLINNRGFDGSGENCNSKGISKLNSTSEFSKVQYIMNDHLEKDESIYNWRKEYHKVDKFTLRKLVRKIRRLASKI